MTVAFAPNHPAISIRLRRRIESWQHFLPSSQFQQYGPINMLLAAFFSNETSLIKPQALIRRMYEGDLGPDDIQAVLTGNVEPNMDGESIEAIQEELAKQHLSIDSGKHIVRTTLEPKKYPDFAVTIYGDAIERKEPENPTGAARVSDDGDVTRILMEIASVPRNAPITAQAKAKVLAQLRGYMDRLGNDGERWDTIGCGIAVIGTEYAQLHPRKNSSGNLAFTKSATWYSIYDSKFIELLEMHAVVA